MGRHRAVSRSPPGGMGTVRLPDGSVDSDTTTPSRPSAGVGFAYVFDLGDDWANRCTVAQQRVGPLEVLGVIPAGPMPNLRWGDLPDHYGRRWKGDDGESAEPARPVRLAGRPAADPAVVGAAPARSLIAELLCRTASWARSMYLAGHVHAYADSAQRRRSGP
jgi:hypothetical protein